MKGAGGAASGWNVGLFPTSLGCPRRLCPHRLLAVALLAGCSLVGVPTGGPREAPAPARPEDAFPRRPEQPDPRRVPEGPAAAAPLRPVPTFGEVRALWVVRTTLTSPERIRSMVDEAQRSGFNTLLVQVRGRGDAYYRSSLEPRAEQLDGQPQGFDPLDVVLREAHASGLAVHAWLNTHLVWGGATLPRDPRHLVRSNPEQLAVPRPLARELRRMPPDDPRYLAALLAHARAHVEQVEGIFTSPSHAAVQERVVRVWREVAERYPLDGMHFDYVRYPSDEYDYSAETLAAFRTWASPRLPAARIAELDRAAGRDPLAWPDALPGPWGDFRRDAVSRLVERVSAEVRWLRPEMVISAAVFGDARDAYQHRFQDWSSWAQGGTVDVLVPMAYTPDDARFRAQVLDAVQKVGAAKVWAGIGSWQNTPEGTVSKIGIARELGARGFALFSYDWAALQSWGGAPFLERVGREMQGR